MGLAQPANPAKARRMTGCRATLRNRFALALLGLVLAMRVLVPAGWMPATGQGFAITICSGSTMESAWVDSDGKVHKQAPSEGGGEHCAFAGLGVPMLSGDVPAPLVPVTPSDETAAASQALAAIGQGLAAPPPPATGPPATV